MLIEELIRRMSAHIKMQLENPHMSGSDFTLDQIMYIEINFNKLVLMRGSCYVELPKWI